MFSVFRTGAGLIVTVCGGGCASESFRTNRLKACSVVAEEEEFRSMGRCRNPRSKCGEKVHSFTRSGRNAAFISRVNDFKSTSGVPYEIMMNRCRRRMSCE